MKIKFIKIPKSEIINYTSDYFIKTANISEKNLPKQKVSMRFFGVNKKDNNYYLCGIQEIVFHLKNWLNKDELRETHIWAQKDGTIMKNGDTVLLIEGLYKNFGIYENQFDGILSRRSSVYTNVKKILNITTKKIIMMADRSDDWINQPFDGYVSYLAGIKNFVTKAQISMIEDADDVYVLGTMPHALIQQNKGDLIASLKSFNSVYPSTRMVALVDYHNDVINDSLAALKKFKKKLYAVRIDTSYNLIDKSLVNTKTKKKEKIRGVSELLIKKCRYALDQNGGKHVKIIVSSKIDFEKVKRYEKLKTPISVYGIGTYFLSQNVFFTADLVAVNNKPESKAGRSCNPEKEKQKLIKFL